MTVTVAELWRYPVKSFQGERVERLDVGAKGTAGDRLLAVVDPAARKVLSAKRYDKLLFASARLDGESVVVTLPGGDSYDAADPAVHGALSAWLDMDVRLEAPPAEGAYPMEMYQGMSDENTPLFDWAGPPGTWLDLADAHFLTTASLRAAATLYPDGEWDVRRFRPTALLEAEGDAYVEEGWANLSLGSAAADVLMPTMRCSMPSRGQPGLSRDKTIGTTIRDGNVNNLGIYCTITQPGTVSVGDPVTVTPK